MAAQNPSPGQSQPASSPTGRRRRAPATGAERSRRDAFGKQWAQAGREIGERLKAARS